MEIETQCKYIQKKYRDLYCVSENLKKLKKMTKVEFENGELFILKGDIVHKYKLKRFDDGSFCLIDNYDNYAANINRITDKGFHFFNYLLNKKTVGYCNFNDMIKLLIP